MILGHDGARKLHTTGHGSIVMRAKAHVEIITSSTGAKGSTRTRNAIVITELPYMTNKAGKLRLFVYVVFVCGILQEHRNRTTRSFEFLQF